MERKDAIVIIAALVMVTCTCAVVAYAGTGHGTDDQFDPTLADYNVWCMRNADTGKWYVDVSSSLDVPGDAVITIMRGETVIVNGVWGDGYFSKIYHTSLNLLDGASWGGTGSIYMTVNGAMVNVTDLTPS